MTTRIPFRIPLALSIVSAVLLILSFPNFDFSFLAWIALAPLFFAIRNKKPSQAFLFGYLTGFIFYLGSLYWLIHVTLPGLILLCLYLALYFGIFTLLSNYTLSANRYPLITVPALWVVLEYLRTNFATGFGWPLLGYCQYRNLAVIQIADITGPYGVSFLIVMINIVVYTLAVRRKLYAIRYPLYAILIVLTVLAYGYSKLGREPGGTEVKISVIQGNIPQDEKWDEIYEGYIFDKYGVLTREAVKEGPDLIIWPETAFPSYFNSENEFTPKMKALAREIRTPILFGAPLIETGLHTFRESRVYNSALLLDGNGEVAQRHDKVHLVPFGEYVPFEKGLGFVERFAKYSIAGFTPGREYTVFSIPEGSRGEGPAPATCSALICFEDIFPRLARRYVQGGASLLVNMTNDAWFYESAAPYQHAQASVFRAVENRVNMIRAANTGLSCFIDTKGRIVSRVRDRSGKDIFVDGYDTEVLKIEKERTFYTKYGDIFAYLCILLSIISLITAKCTPRGCTLEC